MSDAADPLGAPFRDDEMAGRVCLVTGAAQGIGAAIAQRLGEHGAAVALTDLRADAAEARAAALMDAGIQARAWPLDVRDSSAIAAAVSGVEAEWGPIDVVVNNAGVCVVGPAVEIDDDQWALHVDVMLTGPFKVCRQIAAGMLARGRGAIVNVCSISGFGGWPQRAAYNSAKGGVKAFTEAVAVEWADRGVRVNAIAPAVTRTEIMANVLEQGAGRIDVSDFEGRTPMRRLAEPVEMADTVLFLASDRSALITGETLAVDGGWLRSDGFEFADD